MIENKDALGGIGKHDPIRISLPKIKDHTDRNLGIVIILFVVTIELITYFSASASVDEYKKGLQIEQNIKNYSCGELYGFMMHESNKGYVSDPKSYYYSDLLALETKQWNTMKCI